MEIIWPKIDILVALQGFMNKRLLIMDNYSTHNKAVYMVKIESVSEITIFGLKMMGKSGL